MFRPFGGRKHKHNACQTVTADGARFPSRLEARRWGQLLLLQQAGEISSLRRQPRVELTEAKIVYHPDFVYVEKGREIFEETKGFETADYLIKKKLWKVYGPSVLRVMKAAGGQSVRMSEEIIPSGPTCSCGRNKKVENCGDLFDAHHVLTTSSPAVVSIGPLT